MQNQSKRPYKITVILSGRTNQVENPNPTGRTLLARSATPARRKNRRLPQHGVFTPFAVARSKKLLKSKKRRCNMTIEKNGKTYKVAENAKSWTVSILSDCNVTATVKISKSDCPTFDDVKAFIAENDLF